LIRSGFFVYVVPFSAVVIECLQL